MSLPDVNPGFGGQTYDEYHQKCFTPSESSAALVSLDGEESEMAEPLTKALKLMVWLSRNKECLGTLVPYICLPKFMSK